MREITNNPEYAAAETHHIIKFKSNSEKQGAISKARQAIKKRILNKKKDENVKNEESNNSSRISSGTQKKYAAVPTNGIEASLKMTRSETFSNKIKSSVAKLKSGVSSNNPSSRGRSLERRKSFTAISHTLRRSLSRGRSHSRARSVSGAGGIGVKSGLIEKVKSFRRDRSIASVRSVRSNFSVKSSKSVGRMLRFFRRIRNKKDNNVGTEKVVFIKQEYTPSTAPPTPEEQQSGCLLDMIFCNAMENSVCRDLFSNNEDAYDEKELLGEDDIRDFSVDTGSNGDTTGSDEVMTPQRKQIHV